MGNYDALKLDNQICFPLYACSKEVVRQYAPHLEKLDLTYTQYIAMLVLWEYHETTVKKMGELLYLDSGTLTPVLKKLEEKGYISRKRSKQDERSLLVKITKKGEDLKDEAVKIPEELLACVPLEPSELKEFYILLHKLLESL